VHEAQPCVGECKFRVEFDGMLEKRNRCGIPFCTLNLTTRAEGFQCFERRCGGLFKRSIEFLHRVQRLAQFVPNFRSCFSESIEHMALVARLSFRARQRFPAYAVNCLEGQKVRRANLRYRTVKESGAAGPLASLLRDNAQEG